MRLLNSKTLEFEEFYGDDTPKYAILSHRWLDGEVSLREMENGTAKAKAGYNKIKLCCEQAVKDRLDYAWVDTCCIDKTSSAELSEAINCMYSWYEDAQICYVYLSDVHADDASHESFGSSTWFKRGWTLQELIAPRVAVFYNSAWRKIGTKDSLRASISNITRIDSAALEPEADMQDFSIAKRMSWAAGRRTARREDIAYSLLGLFQVNMPMLYGEGTRAFIRLQEEIMKHSDDQSIFAWTNPGTAYRGLLATSPDEFSTSCSIGPSATRLNLKPYLVTNKGISLEFIMAPWYLDTFLVFLDCETEETPPSRLAIFLHKLGEDDQYARMTFRGQDLLQSLGKASLSLSFRNVYVKQRNFQGGPNRNRLYGFFLRNLPFDPDDSETDIRPIERWSSGDRIVEIPAGEAGTAICMQHNGIGCAVKVGFDKEFRPMCYVGDSAIFPGDTTEQVLDPAWMTQEDWKVWENVFEPTQSIPSTYINDRKITIAEEELEGGRLIWVVDIVDMQFEDYFHLETLCDGCDLVSSTEPRILGTTQLLTSCRLLRNKDLNVRLVGTLTIVWTATTGHPNRILGINLLRFLDQCKGK